LIDELLLLMNGRGNLMLKNYNKKIGGNIWKQILIYAWIVNVVMW
jgi:hypothetical protein